MTIVISSNMLLVICAVGIAVFLPELFARLLGVVACAVLVFIMYGFGVPVWIGVPVVLAMLVLAGFIDLPRRQREALEAPPDAPPRTDRDRSSEQYPRHFAEQQRLNEFR